MEGRPRKFFLISQFTVDKTERVYFEVEGHFFANLSDFNLIINHRCYMGSVTRKGP